MAISFTERCMRCGAEITPNEAGLYKKLLFRDAREFLCIHCLAAELGTTEEALRELIEYYKNQGCLLFA